MLLRDSTRDLNADADQIAQGLHMDPNEVRYKIKHFASAPQFQPIYLKEDITQDEEGLHKLRGVPGEWPIYRVAD